MESKSKPSVVFPIFAEPTPITPDLIELLLKAHSDILKAIDTDSFDVFGLVEKVGHNLVLPIVTFYVMAQNDAFKILNKSAFYQMMSLIVSGYTQRNPYHNYLHASEVIQLTHFVLNHCGAKTVLGLDHTEVVGMLVAALIHDLKHPGVGSGFLENSLHELAIRYNNQSILENHHLAEFFGTVLKDDKMNIFKDLSVPDFKKIRKLIITAVLGTDMSKHFEHVKVLKNAMEQDTNGAWVLKKASPQNGDPKVLLLTSILHAVDIGTPTRSLAIFKIWTDRVHNEFFAQGDKEKQMGLPVSFNCDREKTNIHNGQLDYIENFALPLYETIAQAAPGVDKLVRKIKTLRDEWKATK